MAVKDFIPVTESKQTVEKPVKEKPSLKELTTVEIPGKPSPASMLESTEISKKKRLQKKEKVSPTSIERAATGNILIITEKPQAALKIAVALGKAKKISDRGVAYYEVERDDKTLFVGSAVGHLFNLAQVAGQKGWPIFEIEWAPSYERESSAFTKKYYETIKKLAKQSEEIIIATDYDVEGEVIGWNVLRFICHRNTAKRMKFSTLTKTELENSFAHLMDEPDWGNAYAGETRHILDWFYGINLSRALMSAIKTTGSFKVLSIGRVQGPALKIIVEREREIENFKPQPYWQVFALVEGHDFKHTEDIFDKTQLVKFAKINSGVAETKESEEKILPPHPFDLTTLQREAYRLARVSPSQTLAVTQKLYLDGLISYPRTSSQQIPAALQPKNILKNLEKIFPEAKNATRTKPVEGKKTDPAHPSIYPTGEYKKLEANEKKIYDIIARRFISCFSGDAIVKNKRVIITADSDSKIKFRDSGLKIKDKGWTNVYPATLEEKEIPSLSGKVKIDEIKFVEKETQPPKRYTPASLITTLEKKNLGTKATRSIIIDTLFERGYLEGTSIKATPLGMKLVAALEKYSPIIIDENLTRQLEEEMEKIQNKNEAIEKNTPQFLEQKEKEIVEKSKKIIIDISKEFKAREIEIGKEIIKGIQELREEQKESNKLMLCPVCKKNDLRILYSKKTNRNFVACSGYPECKTTFSLPPNSLIKKTEKDCPECRFPKLLAIRKGKRPWEFCFNPNCESNKKRIEEYRAKQAEENLPQK